MSTLLRLLEPSSASTASTASTSTSSTSTSSASASTKPKGKPLVLIVDEFDLFAQHPRQSFLYCLLDIVQGNRRSGGFAVVGVSARVDCLSLLEKRVRSRCQSHVLQMIPPSNFTAFCDLAKRLLGADPRAWELERGEEGRQWAESWNEEVEVSSPAAGLSFEAVADWRPLHSLQRFVQEKKVADYLDRLWSIHGNIPTELRAALVRLLATEESSHDADPVYCRPASATAWTTTAACTVWRRFRASGSTCSSRSREARTRFATTCSSVSSPHTPPSPRADAALWQTCPSRSSRC